MKFYEIKKELLNELEMLKKMKRGSFRFNMTVMRIEELMTELKEAARCHG